MNIFRQRGIVDHAVNGIAMLNCKQVNELAGDYHSGELSLVKRISVYVHLLMCVHCRRYVKQLGVTIDSVKTLAEGSPCSDDEIEKSVNSILGEEKNS